MEGDMKKSLSVFVLSLSCFLVFLTLPKIALSFVSGSYYGFSLAITGTGSLPVAANATVDTSGVLSALQFSTYISSSCSQTLFNPWTDSEAINLNLTPSGLSVNTASQFSANGTLYNTPDSDHTTNYTFNGALLDPNYAYIIKLDVTQLNVTESWRVRLASKRCYGSATGYSYLIHESLVNDSVPPVVTSFIAPSSYASLTVPITAFTATETPSYGIIYYLVTESATPPTATTAGWSATPPTSYTCATVGSKTLYGWARDLKGNVSASRSAPVVIPDFIAPAVSGFIVSTSNSLTVSISTFTATDNIGVTGYLITESPEIPSVSDSRWSTTAPTNFTVSGAGSRTLYAWAKDLAGNISASSGATFMFSTIAEFVVPGSSTSMTIPITRLTTTDPAHVTGYLISESPVKPAANASGWSAAPPASFIATHSGPITLYAWTKDSAGVVSGPATAITIITLAGQSLSVTPMVVAGGSHTLMLKNDGTVWAWGYNGSGQLGDNTTLNRTTPVQASGLSNVIAISAGNSHSAALKSDGTVWTWGNGFTAVPVQTAGASDVASVTAGDNETFILKKDGTIWKYALSYGYGSWSQVNGFNNIIAIAATQYGYYLVALKNDGTVWAKGINWYGQLGDGTTTDRAVPVQVSGINDVISIASGGYAYTMALKRDGTVWGWGLNDRGQLGDGTTTTRSKPVQVSGLYGITAITANSALKNDGTAWMWGGNSVRQVSGLSNIMTISSTGAHNVALKSDYTVWAWGANNYGQLGDGTTYDQKVPAQVNNLTGISAVSAGSYHTVAVKNDGTVLAWGGGNSNYGQLGDGTTLNRTSPTLVSSITGVIAISASDSYEAFTVALKSNGTVWAWGNNRYGQLGDGTTTDRTTPVQVMNLNSIASLSTGDDHTVAVKSDGTVWAWGRNGSGQLGDGSTTSRITPVQVTGVSGIIAVAAGQSYTLALKNDGTVWAWGYNDYGQLGDGTKTGRTTPVQVKNISDVVAISAGGGRGSSFVLKNDGTVWGWGYNYDGQLGNGTTTDSLVPVQAIGLYNIKAISVSGDYYHVIALKNDGTVWAWGYGQQVLLSDGTWTDQSIPRQVGGLDGITALSAGYLHNVALKNDGTVWTWGDNWYGQLGFDYYRAVPAQANSVPLPIITSFTVPAASSGATVPITSFTALTGTSISGWCVTESSSSANCQWSAAKPDSYTFTTLTEGVTPHILYAFVKDSVGNLSGTMVAVVTVTTLNQSPQVTAFTIPSTAIRMTVPITSFTATDNFGVTGYLITESPEVPSANSSAWSQTAPALFTVSTVGTSTLYAWAKDAVGNISPARTANITIELDHTPPVITAFTIPTDSISRMIRITAFTATDNVAVSDYCLTETPSSVGCIWTLSAPASYLLSGIGSGGATAKSLYAFARDSSGNVSAPATATLAAGALRPLYARISVSGNHTLALKSDGTVWAWGMNWAGQLGDGTTTTQTTPVQVTALSGIIAVAAGDDHSLALRSDGTVWAWGRNWYGQIGDGSYWQDRKTPVQATLLTDGIAVAAGRGFSLALKSDGTVWAWGANGSGQLGDSSSVNRLEPVQVTGLTGVTRITAGAAYAGAVRNDGTAWMWGANSDGQLGDGTTTGRSTPDKVIGLDTVSAIAAGGDTFDMAANWSSMTYGTNHTVAVKGDGTVWAWGRGVSSPAQVTVLAGIVDIAAGRGHSLALDHSGQVWSWGANDSGQLGDGSTSDSYTTPLQISGVNDVIAISAGGRLSAAMLSDGTVAMFGRNTNGQLGDDSKELSLTPVTVAALSGITAVSAGDSHSIALSQAGDVYVWGNNASGQLGDGTTTSRNVPVKVAALAGITSIAAGGQHSLALNSNGGVFAWGSNYMGQIGDGTTTSRTSPLLLNGISSVTGLTASGGNGGGVHSTALKTDGTVWEWGGYLEKFENGSNWINWHLTPVKVSTIGSVIAVASGNGFSVALKTDGTALAWGMNSSGALGDGTQTSRVDPVSVNGLSNVTRIAAGDYHALALKNDGTVWAWGFNGSGQIGDGTQTIRSTPVQVSTLSGMIAIAAGNGFSLALKNDGTLWAWGNNSNGQLGDGTTSNRFTPVRIPALTGVQGIAAGGTHSLAFLDDGTLKAWGDSTSGQLGNGYSRAPHTAHINLGDISHDSDEPVIVRFEVPSYSRNPHVALGISVIDNVAVTAYCLSEVEDANACVWGTEKPAAYDFTSEGVKTLYLQVKDSSGNRAITSSLVTVDITAPVVSGFTLPAQSPSLTVMISQFDATDNVAVAQYCLSETNSSSGCAWGSLAPRLYRFSSAGEKTLYAFVRDGAGNVSSSVSAALVVTDSYHNSYTQVATSGSHIIAVKGDGTVWAWGANGSGQLGDGTKVDRAIPVQVPGLTDVKGVAVSYSASVALKNDGTVWAWGDTVVTPVQLAGLSDVTTLAAGSYFALALKKDGTVWSWGYNGYGQLGNGSTNDWNIHSTPMQVNLLSDVVSIIATGNTAMAIKSDGTLWAWGENYAGKLGNGTSDYDPHPIPEQVNGVSGVTTVALGTGHVLIAKSDGTAWGWGNNYYGHLGDGTTTGRTTPVQVSGLTNVAKLVVGDSHSVALRNDGTVWGWGYDGGIGHTTPVQIADLFGITDISAGSNHTLAIDRVGQVWSWGANESGQLGDGTRTRRTTPGLVNGITGVVALAARDSLSVATLYDGSLQVFGNNLYGQHGNGTESKSRMPLVVTGLSGVTSISAGERHSIALLEDGSLRAWGANEYGQRGDSVTSVSATPLQVSSLSGWKTIASRNNSTLAIKNDGAVWGWGSTYGTSPQQISGLTGITVASVGSSYALFLKNDGTVWGRGYNGYGQLGDGTTNSSYDTPVQATGLSTIAAIASNQGFSLALKDNGTVWTWGANYNGELGDGTTISHATPAQVGSLFSIAAIAAGSSHALALKNDGTVWAWGDNNSGQLGDGTHTRHTEPVQVATLVGITAIAANGYYSLALKNDGTVWAWGDNSYGQLGDGTTTPRTIPVQISGLGGGVALAAGTTHAMALIADGTVKAWGDNRSWQLGADYSLLPNEAMARSTINGACGTANDSAFSKVPAADLCTSGTASTITGSGPWSWNCLGSNGGTTSACNANIQTYIITPTVTDGNGTVNCTSPVNSGTTSTCTVTATTGYQLATFTDNSVDQKTSVSGGSYSIANVTANHTVVATFTDSQNPAVSSFIIPASATTLTVAITTFTATDNAAVTGYLLTESTTAPAATDAGWSQNKPASYAFSNIPDGVATAKNLYAWAKDAAGNISSSATATTTITLPDVTKPIVTTFTVPATGTSLTVPVSTFTATDNVAVTGYLLSETVTAPTATVTGWSEAAPTNYTFSGLLQDTATGRTLYAWAKDAAGNISTSLSGTISISKASASVVLGNMNQNYDGNQKIVSVTTTPAGLTVDLTYNGSSTAPTNSGTYNVVGTINDSSYQGTISGTLTIGKAPQTITFAATATKTYGNADFGPGATVDTNLPLNYASDTPDVATITAEGLVHIAGAGTATITATQSGDSNHLPTSAVQTLTISKVQIQVTADNKSRSYAATDPAFTATYSGFVKGENATVITGVPTFSTSATNTSHVGSYAITPDISALTAANYNFSAAPGTLAIGLASQTITFNPLAAKTYGDLTFKLSATGGASNNPLTYSSSDTSVAVVSENTVTIVGSGSTTITVNQAGTTDEYATATAQQTLTVNKANLTVTADNKQRSYNTANPDFTATYSGFVNNEDITVLTGTPTFSTTATQISLAGSYTITPIITSLTATNYTFAAATGTLAVDLARQSITFNQLAVKTYGDATFDLTATGGASNNTITFSSSDATVATVNGATVTVKAAGSTTITASQAGITGEYAAATAQQTLTINKATLTVTADSKQRSYNSSDPIFTVTYSGFAGSDDVTVLQGAPALSSTASITSPVGDYPVTATVGNLSANNYNFSYAAGILTVTKATASILFDNASLNQTYSGIAKSVSASTTPPGLNVSFTYAGNATGPNNVGTYDVVAAINDSNYQGSATSKLVIGKATASVTLGSLNQNYDSAQKAATATTTPTGFAFGFTYDGSTTAPTNAGTYAVVGTINDSNYQGSSTGSLVIGKGTATITLGNLSATFDGAAKSATATTNPVGLTVAFTYNGATAPPVNVGNYTVIATISDNNYQGSATGTLVIITQAFTLTVSHSGTGNGSIHSSPMTGISCSKGSTNGCSGQFSADVTLTAVPEITDSVFSGWINACLTTQTDCLVSMTSNKTAVATFTLAPKTKLDLPATTGYDTLPLAYGSATSTIFALDGLFTGAWTLDQSKNITLKGGYLADYGPTRNGFTVLGGKLIISNGSLRVEGLKIRP